MSTRKITVVKNSKPATLGSKVRKQTVIKGSVPVVAKATPKKNRALVFNAKPTVATAVPGKSFKPLFENMVPAPGTVDPVFVMPDGSKGPYGVTSAPFQLPRDEHGVDYSKLAQQATSWDTSVNQKPAEIKKLSQTVDQYKGFNFVNGSADMFSHTKFNDLNTKLIRLNHAYKLLTGQEFKNNRTMSNWKDEYFLVECTPWEFERHDDGECSNFECLIQTVKQFEKSFQKLSEMDFTGEDINEEAARAFLYRDSAQCLPAIDMFGYSPNASPLPHHLRIAVTFFRVCEGLALDMADHGARPSIVFRPLPGQQKHTFTVTPKARLLSDLHSKLRGLMDMLQQVKNTYLSFQTDMHQFREELLNLEAEYQALKKSQTTPG